MFEVFGNMSSSSGVTWSKDEIQSLFSIWGDPKYQQKLKGAKKKNIHIYEEISSDLKNLYRINRTAVQCREKVKKLRGSYFKCQDENRKSGNSLHQCEYYKELHEILHERPLGNPHVYSQHGKFKLFLQSLKF